MCEAVVDNHEVAFEDGNVNGHSENVPNFECIAVGGCSILELPLGILGLPVSIVPRFDAGLEVIRPVLREARGGLDKIHVQKLVDNVLRDR